MRLDFSKRRRLAFKRYCRLDFSKPPVSGAELRAAAALRHAIKIGRPGSLKTTSGRRDIQDNIGKRFLLVEDPHGTYHDAIIADNPRYEHLIETFDINRPDCVCPINLFPWSASPSLGKRIQDNEAAFDRAISIIGRDDVDPLLHPMHGLGQFLARAIMTHRNDPVDFLRVWDVFRKGPGQDELLSPCWDRRAVEEIRKINAMRSHVERERIVGPFQRNTDPFITSLYVQAIFSRPGVPWLQWMQQKKCVIVRAHIDTPGTLVQPVFGMLRHLTVHTAMQHLDETGRPLPADIHADEAARLAIRQREAALMGQCRKAGVAYKLYYQRIPSDEYTKDLRATIGRYEIYPVANADEAEQAAREIAAFLFDSRKPKRVERRERAINRGIEREEIEVTNTQYDKRGNKAGKTQHKQFLTDPIIDTVIDEHIVDERHDDVVHDWMRIIRKLDIGQRLVIDGNTVTDRPEPVPMPTGPRDLTDADRSRVRDAVSRITQRDHYFTPDFESMMQPQEIQDEPDGEIEEWDSTRSAASRWRDGDI